MKNDLIIIAAALGAGAWLISRRSSAAAVAQPEEQPRLVIHSAVIGSQYRKEDITDKIRELVVGGVLDTYASRWLIDWEDFDSEGDKLYLDYTLDGERHREEYAENERVMIW